jgi:hypothetical protein
MSGQGFLYRLRILSVPSPCERPYRLGVLWTDPTPEGLRLSYLSFQFGLPVSPDGGYPTPSSSFGQELFGSPKFYNISLHTCHALRGPRQTLRNLTSLAVPLCWLLVR